MGDRLAGFVKRPSSKEIRELAAMEYMEIDLEEAETLAAIIDQSLDLIDALDEIPLPPDFMRVHHRQGRDQGYRPDAEEDPYNVFIRKCRVEGSEGGLLSGRTVGLKDNIRVAGIPMTNASRMVGSYVPTVDAIVVERLLENGATIVGKLNMDDMSFAGTGETSVFGPVRNPANPSYSAGGSSAGSGAAVAAGEVDLAIGVDEGGSGRIPAAWCGVASLKPTHGLVPTFGLTYMDHTLDFVCPMAKSVDDVALTLQAIAGPDPRDPQWTQSPIQAEDYLSGIDDGVDGLRIGLVRESVGLDVSDPDVDEATKGMIRKLEQVGAEVSEVSIPLWPNAWAIWNGFTSHSISAMIESDLEGYWRRGVCDPDWQLAFGMARRSGAFDPSPQLKVLMILGKYLRRRYCSTYFSKATNLRYIMTSQVEDLFQTVDLLVTPTCPMKAFPLATEPISLDNFASRSASMTQNTSPTNVTGHPSANVPIGKGENGLPIGLQIIGPLFGEARVLQAAKAVENIAGEK